MLVTYFSWSGSTKNLAEEIQRQTNADIYRIEPLVPYTDDYQELAYQISNKEKEENARPALKDTLSTLNDYDIIFVGCPVWWFDAPMIIHSFLECEDYHFGGKTVIPFCTFATAEYETLYAFKYFLPISGDCWSLGAFAGMNQPQRTTDYLAGIVRQSPYANDFYIWAASGTSDSAYSEILLQVRAMSGITDVFGLAHMTFHEKDGARHEFRPTVEYVYNALPFFFPASGVGETAIRQVGVKAQSSVKAYSINGMLSNGQGIVIQNGKKIINPKR